MDVSAIVLNKLISEGDLDCWSKVKLAYIDPAYTSIYAAIKRHYQQYHKLPTFDELEITQRDSNTKNVLATIRLLEIPDISIDVALDALVDQFTQNEAIRLLDKYLDHLTIYNTVEVKENLSAIVMQLDDKTHSSENVYTMDNINLFKRPEQLDRDRTYLGLNNTFDSAVGGVARQELVLIGGPRGSGKSIVSSNIVCTQYEAGNTCVYFSIEMVAHETLERKLAILADVCYKDLKLNKLPDSELLKVVRKRAEMFVDSEDVVSNFLKHRDKWRFEEELLKTKKLKEDNQIIIVDDRALTITALDLHLGKFKSKFGDKLRVAVVDYVNQIVLEGSHSAFDWQPQLIVSKQLKELARKYDLTIVSPYQVDATGEARFAKGILDAADIAMVLEAHDNAISFDTTKIRGAAEMGFTSPINWDSLRISPVSVDRPEKKKQVKKDKVEKHEKPTKSTGEPAGDLPWD